MCHNSLPYTAIGTTSITRLISPKEDLSPSLTEDK